MTITDQKTLVQEFQQALADGHAAPTLLGVDQSQPMTIKVTALQQRYAALTVVKSEVLKENVDYGYVGDSAQPALRQPGAQKLGILFGLHDHLTFEERVEDWMGTQHGGEPFFRYLIKCVLTDDDGKFAGESFGEVNSWDAKYRWRWVQAHKVPEDVKIAGLRKRVDYAEEFVFAIDKAETTGKYGKPPEYWQMFKDAMSAGKAVSLTKTTKKGPSPAYRVETVTYRLPNDDIFSQVNTILKMAQKRAFVGAILVTTGASEFFTQDLDDMSEETLENMGVRKGRATAPETDADPDVTPPTRQGRQAPEPPAKTNGKIKTDWRKAPGANMIPALKRATKINDSAVLFAMLEAAGDTINAGMTAEKIAGIITNAPSAPAPASDEPPAPEQPVSDTNIPDDVDPADLPF